MIRTESLCRVYRKGEASVAALSDITLHIATGEFVAVTGASGSGKSTLLNVLGCLDQPTAGSYRINGQDVSMLADQELSAIRNREIGFVFQSFNLVPHLNVLENIEIPLFYHGVPGRERRRRCIELIERVGLRDRMTHASSELSGGECQRVAIARAVANAPAIILADEPTGNLDRDTGKEIMTLFQEMHASGKTLIIVTHDMQIASYADRIIRLDGGRLDESRLCENGKDDR